MHGSGDDATAWTNVGRAHLIADNLIAQKKAEPMIVVMPTGHAHFPGVDLDEIADRGEWYQENNAAVFADLEKVLLPLIRETYRVRSEPRDWAIAGLSMGGGQSLEFGLGRPEQFAWVAGFSSATAQNEEAAQEKFRHLKADHPFKLIWIGCGRSDFLLDRNEFFRAWLERKGVQHTYKLTEGGHAWPVWRSYLEEVLPMLFKG